MKPWLREAFEATLREIAPGPRVAQAVRQQRSKLQRCERAIVIAIGKAARPMATAALAELAAIAPQLSVRGLCCPPDPDRAPLPPLEVVPGGHPLPTQGSLDAAQRALDLCNRADDRTFVLFLVSGGASSQCEFPALSGATVAQWRAFYAALVGSGAGIEDINVVRTFASATKGGQLMAAAHRAFAQCTLGISDVPYDAIATLGSGPTVPRACNAQDLERALRHDGLRRAVHASLPDGFLQQQAERTAPLMPNMSNATAQTLMSNATAIEIARRHLEARSVRVVLDNSQDEANCEDAAARLLASLDREASARPGPVAILAGGEVRVALPERTGVGGRNQHFLLSVARRIEGQNIAALSCGTDGIDGNSSAAGGVVDGDTVRRARQCGLDIAAALATFDSSSLLSALGDAIVTGPTGVNVRDLRLLIRHAEHAAPTR